MRRRVRRGGVPGPAVLVVLAVLVGPVGPVGPVAPTGSVASAGPVGPVGPLVPVGSFGWPLAGVDPTGPPAPGAAGTVVRRFLPPPTPYGRGHRGADLAAAAGTPVLAAGAGVVAYAGPLAGRGVVSVVHAGGLRTTYEPVAASVAVGTAVARGVVLGRLDPGHRGCPAACLHWGLRRAAPGGEQYLDPLLLVGLGRVRLLPTDEPDGTDGTGGTVSGR